MGTYFETTKEHLGNARALISAAIQYGEKSLQSNNVLQVMAEMIKDLRAADARLEFVHQLITPEDQRNFSPDEIDYLACVLSRFPPKEWAETPPALRTVWEARALVVLRTLASLRTVRRQ